MVDVGNAADAEVNNAMMIVDEAAGGVAETAREI